MLAINAEYMKELMNSLTSDKPQEIKEKDNKEQLYYEALSSLLGMKKNNKHKLK